MFCLQQVDILQLIIKTITKTSPKRMFLVRLVVSLRKQKRARRVTTRLMMNDDERRSMSGSGRECERGRSGSCSRPRRWTRAERVPVGYRQRHRLCHRHHRRPYPFATPAGNRERARLSTCLSPAQSFCSEHPHAPVLSLCCVSGLWCGGLTCQRSFLLLV